MGDTQDSGGSTSDVLVSTGWLAEHLNDSAVRIVESNESKIRAHLQPYAK